MKKFEVSGMKIKKINDYLYELEQRSSMNVPVKIFASEALMENLVKDNAIMQAKNMTEMPGIQKNALIMPDAHQGYGFPVGGVAAFPIDNGCISPGGTGFDINCGVRLLSTQLTKEDVEPKIKELLDVLFQNVHCGVGSESNVRLTHAELDEVLNGGLDWAKEHGYATQHDIDHCEENGRMKQADAGKVSPTAKKRGKNQLGTLGAGNHFLEIQIVDEIFDEKTAKAFEIYEKGQIVVMIHSGSRGLGHQVCTDFLRRIEDELPELIAKLPEKDLAYAPTSSPIAKDYLQAMAAAANFGWCNRQLMVFNIRKSFAKVFGTEYNCKQVELKTVYDVAHNIVKVEEYIIDGVSKKLYVHRKGATRAFGPNHKELPRDYQKTGQPILLPGSMGTASYVLVGTDKAMQETFASTPHGAGRVMSRNAANKLFKGEQIKNELEKRNIFIKSASWKGLSEEAPAVYKDVDEVVRVSHEAGIGKLVAKLVPFGVLKG